MSRNKNDDKTVKQAMLPLGGSIAPPAKNPPATELMKIVAKRAPKKRMIEKVFSGEEMREIEDVTKLMKKVEQDNTTAREKYRKIKRLVKEMEYGNNQKIIVFPSLVNGDNWYKVVEFSALYYVYRLAPRMGRKAHIYKDSDKYSKCLFSATFQNIEKFVFDMDRLDDLKPEISDDGVYIFTLKKPLTDDEMAALKLTEETRREKLHNVVRPINMNPKAYRAVLMVMRQVAPRARKLEKQYYYTTGEMMVKNTQELLAVYFDFANGLYSKDETGRRLMVVVDRLLAGLTLLAENRVWAYDTAAMIGESINEIRRIVIKDFDLKVSK